MREVPSSGIPYWRFRTALSPKTAGVPKPDACLLSSLIDGSICGLRYVKSIYAAPQTAKNAYQRLPLPDVFPANFFKKNQNELFMEMDITILRSSLRECASKWT
jgi:hypothetical protein